MMRSSVGAWILAATGVGAAFGAAACCALPLLLATVGISSTWLVGVALVAGPHRNIVLALAAIALAGGGFLLWRQQRRAMTCAPNTLCMRASARTTLLIVLVIGAALLWGGYVYV